MNKKVLVTGLLVFWSGVAGYMGMRILESYAEDAVQAALSAIPATAEEIRFSLLDKSLKIKGIAYEIPDEKIQRKGTIAEAEVKGFNRKILYVLPKMDPYDPESLPKVADAISLKGLSETSHVGYEIITRTIGNVEIVNWHQRLGLVLDQYSRYGAGERFYEELFRCRMDEVKFSAVETVIRDNTSSQPITFRIAEGSLPGGIHAPKAGAFVAPVSLRLKGMTFAGGNGSGALETFELKDVVPPEPKQLAQMIEFLKTVYTGTEEDFEKLKELCAQAWKDRLPISSVSAGGGLFRNGDNLIRFRNILYSIAGNAEGGSQTLKIQNVRIPAETMEELADTVKRFAPDGLDLSLDCTSRYSGTGMAGTAEYTLKDLGRLRVAAEFKGDVKEIQRVARTSTPEEALALLSRFEIRKFSADYEDWGLLPLCMAVFAEGSAEELQDALTLIQQEAAAMRRKGGVFWTELAHVLEEQFNAPGTVHVDFEAPRAVSLMQLTMMMLTKSGELPVTLSSTPGPKALSSYPILN